MTPQMKKALTALKKLSAYELAMLNNPEGDVQAGDAILSIIATLDKHLALSKVGSHGLTAEEFQLVLEGKKIQAIKAVRERTTMGLADAKAYVEKAQAALGLQNLKNTQL